jgi:hypothetical protein
VTQDERHASMASSGAILLPPSASRLPCCRHTAVYGACHHHREREFFISSQEHSAIPRRVGRDYKATALHDAPVPTPCLRKRSRGCPPRLLSALPPFELLRNFSPSVIDELCICGELRPQGHAPWLRIILGSSTVTSISRCPKSVRRIRSRTLGASDNGRPSVKT